jgi:hypothetical protein
MKIFIFHLVSVPLKGSFKKNGSYCYSCLIYSFLWFYWI